MGNFQQLNWGFGRDLSVNLIFEQPNNWTVDLNRAVPKELEQKFHFNSILSGGLFIVFVNEPTLMSATFRLFNDFVNGMKSAVFIEFLKGYLIFDQIYVHFDVNENVCVFNENLKIKGSVLDFCWNVLMEYK